MKRWEKMAVLCQKRITSTQTSTPDPIPTFQSLLHPCRVKVRKVYLSLTHTTHWAIHQSQSINNSLSNERKKSWLDFFEFLLPLSMFKSGIQFRFPPLNDCDQSTSSRISQTLSCIGSSSIPVISWWKISNVSTVLLGVELVLTRPQSLISASFVMTHCQRKALKVEKDFSLLAWPLDQSSKTEMATWVSPHPLFKSSQVKSLTDFLDNCIRFHRFHVQNKHETIFFLFIGLAKEKIISMQAM